MECMLVPEKPTAPLPKVPCVATRWDGGPWLRYPLRAGRPEMLPDLEDPTHIPWDTYEAVHPTPNEELETFFQTWLLFGLLAEAFDGNEPDLEEAELPESSTGNSPEKKNTTKTGSSIKINSTTTSKSRQGDLTDRVEASSFDIGEKNDDSATSLSSGLDSSSSVAVLSADQSKIDEVVLHHRQKPNIINQIYEDFITQINGQPFITTEKLLQALQDSWAITPIEVGLSTKKLEARYKRLRPCLMKAYYFYSHIPKTFSPLIKTSIGVVAEIIANAMLAVCLLINSNEYSPSEWSFPGFFSEEVKSRMNAHGWCPSDIARIKAKYRTLHAIYFISLLDKRLPERGHSRCTDDFCEAYQIDPDTYGLTHAEEGCKCKHVTIDNSQVVRALKNKGSLPLLKFLGEKDKLKIEVVTSKNKTPYVALSHVWADGLGNPKGNALHACKLIKLRNLIEALPPISENDLSEGGQTECPLIWLDTLCCPVEPECAKKLSLAKMRQTYKESTVVLVLDASLQCYSSERMTPIEILARIFTSSWLRRLWTLQEGALAKQLYFQFADRAVSLASLKALLVGVVPELRWRIFAGDVGREIDQIEQFFQPRNHRSGDQNLRILDDALKHRGVSVPTDEPLCIGTLMSLPEKPILAVRENDRMRVVWQLLAKKFPSIPAQIIFFEEPRLTAVGFRWAPRSFLTTEKTIFSHNTRSIRWDDPKPGYLTPKGLKVQYPGFRLTSKVYNDGKPRHPWKGLKRIPESKIIFRDSANGNWHFVSTKQSALRNTELSTEELKEFGNNGLFPLHEMMHKLHEDKKEDFFVLLPDHQHQTPHFQRNATDALIMSGAFETPSPWKWLLSFFSFWSKPSNSKPIVARTEFRAMAGPLNPIEALLYSTAEPLAMQLRASPITDELLAIKDQDSEEYKDVLERLKDEMKRLMAEAFAANETLNNAVKRLWGDDIHEYLWPTIGDWFNHDFWATQLEDEQVWYVD